MSGPLVESFGVAATLAAQRIVAPITGTANAVQLPVNIGVAQPLLGVSVDTVKDTNQSIAIQVSGLAKVLFNDTCPAGALVTADTAGRAVPFAAITATSSNYVGILVDASVAATGTVAKILIQPGQAIAN